MKHIDSLTSARVSDANTSKPGEEIKKQKKVPILLYSNMCMHTHTHQSMDPQQHGEYFVCNEHAFKI